MDSTTTESFWGSDLSKMIGEKQNELLRVTNSAMVILFWEIGAELKQHFIKNRRKAERKFPIESISARLSSIYGPFFFEKNLKNMVRFLDEFPDLSIVNNIAPVLTWEHILALLPLKELEARSFYIRLTAEKGLTVIELRKHIAENLFELSKADKKNKRIQNGRTLKITKKFLDTLLIGVEQQLHNNSSIKNVFKEPALYSFRPLLEPLSGLSIEKNTKTPDVEELIGIIVQHIEKYSKQQNYWLNANLNKFFWEIGKILNQWVISTISSNRESIIRDAAILIRKKYGPIFNKKQLDQMSKFAEQINDSLIALRIANLVRWEHISVLLSVCTIEAKLFYARLTAAKGLSVASLRKQIAKNIYEQTKGAKELEQNAITALQNSIRKEESIKKKGNATVTITSMFLDLGDDVGSSRAVTNIYKNPHFQDFIAAI